MSECTLPRTGGAWLPLTVVAIVLLAIGTELVVLGRRRRFGRSTTMVVVALATAATAFGVGGARTASAATDCIPTSTTTATTTAPTTTVTSRADLTPVITGPVSFTSGVPNSYMVTVTNVGTGTTTGTMSFDVVATPEAIGTSGAATYTPFPASGWSVTHRVPGFTFGSDPGTVLAPGASATMTIMIQWDLADAGDAGTFQLGTTLPDGIGGETNSANNAASLTVNFAAV